MSEVLGHSPLDTIRSLHKEATQLDWVMDSMVEMKEIEFKDFIEEIEDVNSRSDLLDEEVTVYGNRVAVSLDEDGNTCTPFSTPLQNEQTTVSGIFKGYNSLIVYDPHSKERFYRVVAKIETDRIESADAWGTEHVEMHHAFMLAEEGSSIVPDDVCESHSLIDLIDDPVIDRIDEYVFDETMDAQHVLRSLAKVFCKVKNSSNADIDRQRLSYLNSLELLVEKKAISRDVAFIKDEKLPENMISSTYTSLEDKYRIMPLYFITGPSYRRKKGGVEFSSENLQELYVAGYLDDYMVYTPARQIIDLVDDI